jgi:hypothetical protein
MCKRCCKQGFHLSEHFQKTLYCKKDRRNSDSLLVVRTMCHPFRTPICPLFHPSGQCVITSRLQTEQHHSSRRSVRSVRTSPLYQEGSIQLASVWTFQQHVRTPLSTRSVSDFFPSSKKGKINQPSGQCGIPSGRVSP